MSRYAQMFDRLQSRGEGAFGGFLMLGDPGLKRSAELLDCLVAGGADMVEVGIPFSDPVADGPAIQAAAKRALDAGVRVEDCFDLIAGFRARHPSVPLGILTYSNLVVARGRGSFFERCAKAGADSLLVADLPSIEARPWADEMRAAGVAPVLVAASNTPDDRLSDIARIADGYTYCVTRAGVTGTHDGAGFDSGLIRRLDERDAPPPVFGFGISTPEQVRSAVRAGARGAISGSAIVQRAAEGGDVEALVAMLKSGTRERVGTAMI